MYGQGWAGDTFGDVLTSSFPTQVQQTVTPASNAAAVFNLTNVEDGVQPGPPGYTFPAIPSDGAYVLTDGISQTARPTQVRLPTVQGWNVMVQHEITPTLSLQVGYVGSEAYHNMFESSPSFNANERTLAGFGQINPNTHVEFTEAEREPFYNGVAQSQLGVKYGVPHQWTQRIDYMANQATGSYNALQLVVNKRVSSGLSFLAHYTWSHELGHESYEFLIDPKIGRGNGYYNRRHAFVFAGNYDLPFGRDRQFASSSPRWVNGIIGGFQLNGSVTIDGGIPFTTNYDLCSQDNDVGASDNACFLNHTGASFGTHKGSFDPVAHYVRYFTPAPYILGGTNPDGTINPTSYGPFSRPAMGTWGNTGRDALWGPSLITSDLSLQKSFTIHEGVRMLLVAQAFNAFNHVNLANPDTCFDCQDLNSVGVQNAGTIQGTVSEQDGTSLRRLQFAARFQF